VNGSIISALPSFLLLERGTPYLPHGWGLAELLETQQKRGLNDIVAENRLRASDNTKAGLQPNAALAVCS